MSEMGYNTLVALSDERTRGFRHDDCFPAAVRLVAQCLEPLGKLRCRGELENGENPKPGPLNEKAIARWADVVDDLGEFEIYDRWTETQPPSAYAVFGVHPHAVGLSYLVVAAVDDQRGLGFNSLRALAKNLTGVLHLICGYLEFRVPWEVTDPSAPSFAMSMIDTRWQDVARHYAKAAKTPWEALPGIYRGNIFLPSHLKRSLADTTAELAGLENWGANLYFELAAEPHPTRAAVSEYFHVLPDIV